MEITIFAKKRTSKDGRPFVNYLTTLTRKDGTTQSMQVKFRDDCGSPKAESCPLNIAFKQEDANVSKRVFTREDTGEQCEAFTLWISAWTNGTPYVDHSLDDFV